MEYIRKNINYLNIILIILLSNTVYFGLINRKSTLVVFIFTTIIALLINNINLKKENIIILLILSISIIMSVVLNIDIVDKTYIISIIQNLIILWSVGICVGYIEKQYFINKFIDIICFFSVISIICIFISNFIPQYSSFFYESNEYAHNNYLISPFYMWGNTEVWTRNSGPFWEPGAFQGFINIAILFILTSNINIRNMNIKLIILVITLLTTQSTTGYILFVLNIIFFGGEILRKLKRNNLLLKIFMVVIFTLGITVIFTSNNIEEKFTSKENPSATIRANDVINSIKLISERPLRGIGYGEFKGKQEKSIGVKNNSNGLLLMIYMDGILFSILYIYFLFRGIKEKFIETKNIKILLLVMNFVILYFTEGLVWLPFFIVFLFKFRNNDRAIGKSIFYKHNRLKNNISII